MPGTGVEYGLLEEPRVASPLLVAAPPVDPLPAAVDTRAIPAALPAVAAPVVAPVGQHEHHIPSQAVANAPGDIISSPRRVATTRKPYARMATGLLMPLPPLPFSTDHSM